MIQWAEWIERPGGKGGVEDTVFVETDASKLSRKVCPANGLIRVAQDQMLLEMRGRSPTTYSKITKRRTLDEILVLEIVR